MRPRWARDQRWSGAGRIVPATPPAEPLDDGVGDAEVAGVGDVRMVRTFRVGADGGLYPVNSATAWVEGWNSATCLRDRNHRPPEAQCRCGFYAYSDPAYVLAQPPARQVIAVVATHGTMEAGTRGARVERARIEAIWFGERVSEQLADAVRRRYPGVALYRDRAAMTAAHPLTQLEYFRAPRVGEGVRGRLRTLMWTFLAVVAAVGCVPSAAVVSSPVGAIVWLTLLATGLAIMLAGIGQRSSVVTLQGLAATGWLVTSNPTTASGWAGRTTLALLMAWVMLIWWRAATPGRRVRVPRVERFFRRVRGQLPGTR